MHTDRRRERRLAAGERKAMMNLVSRLEEYRAAEAQLSWEGPFHEYYDQVLANPGLARLSHARVYDMLMAAGADPGPNDHKQYRFFTSELYGMEKPLEQLVD